MIPTVPLKVKTSDLTSCLMVTGGIFYLRGKGIRAGSKFNKVELLI